jgi:PAS domain S-box-containing protein
LEVFSVLKFFTKRRKKRAEAFAAAISAIRSDKNVTEALEGLKAASILKPAYDAVVALHESNRKREASRLEIMNMVCSATESMEIEKLLDALMPKLIENTKSVFGAFYLANNATGKLELKSSVGFGRGIYNEFDLTIGEGIIGLAAKKLEVTVISDLQDDSIYVTKTIMGNIKPKNLMLVPIINRDTLLGILALGSLTDYSADEFEIIDIIKYYVGTALANGVIYERSRRQARELEFQNQLIQGLNAELERKVADHGVFLNDTINSIMDYAIYTTNLDGKVLLWNSGAETIYGYTAKEVLGKNINELLKTEEFAKISMKKRVAEVQEHGRCVNEGWRRRSDGTICYVSMSIFGLYDHDGKIVGITNVTHDITELKNSQDDLILARDMNEKLFENSSRAGLLIDYNDIILKTNIRSREFFGREFDYTQLEGRRLSDLFTDISPVRICMELSDGIGSCDLVTKNGNALHVQMFGVRDSSGYFVRMVLQFPSSILKIEN